MWFCFSTFKYIGSLWQENEEIKLWTKLVATTVAGKKPVSCSSKLTVAIVVWRQPIYADESHTHTHTLSSSLSADCWPLSVESVKEVEANYACARATAGFC